MPDIEDQINEDQQKKEMWISRCCNSEKKISKELIKYISQLSISLIILVFSMIQLSKKDDINNQSLYVSLITLIIGVYIPSPEHRI